MVRQAYLHELRSAATFPLASSLAEGAFTGIVAAKYFHASELMIAVITAAPMFGNIMALMWSDMARRRRKVPFVNMLQLGVVLTIASCALTAFVPSPALGGWIFACLIVLARVLASGIITIRSTIWRSNYPRQTRAQIVSRISVVATAVLAISTFTGAKWLDHNSRAFIYLYPGAAALGAIGIYQFAGIRVRNEGRTLRRARAQAPIQTVRPESMAQTDESNVMNYAPAESGPGFLRMFGKARALLKEDANFRDYQRWQFISGVSFMMFGPSLLYMVGKEMTDPTKQYLLATCVLQIIPMLTSLVASQLWAPWFDRMHITRFRVVQGFVSVSAMLMLYVGALWGWRQGYPYGLTTALLIVAAAQVLFGITNAAGNLAWNLGHNDFAPAERSAEYMAVHVMLTGLRGCVAPFLGVALYKLPYVGRNIFLLSAIISSVALCGYWSLSKRMAAKPKPTAPPPNTVAHAMAVAAK